MDFKGCYIYSEKFDQELSEGLSWKAFCKCQAEPVSGFFFTNISSWGVRWTFIIFWWKSCQIVLDEMVKMNESWWNLATWNLEMVKEDEIDKTRQLLMDQRSMDPGFISILWPVTSHQNSSHVSSRSSPLNGWTIKTVQIPHILGTIEDDEKGYSHFIKTGLCGNVNDNDNDHEKWRWVGCWCQRQW